MICQRINKKLLSLTRNTFCYLEQFLGSECAKIVILINVKLFSGNHFKRICGTQMSELKLDVIQESDSFAMWDAVDGIIAMAWENLEGYDEYPEKRLFFEFGEKIDSVESKLYEKDMVLSYNNELING